MLLKFKKKMGIMAIFSNLIEVSFLLQRLASIDKIHLFEWDVNMNYEKTTL